MNTKQILDLLDGRKGQNLSVVWERALKTRKGVEARISKVTTLVARTGVAYDNISAVKEAREDGTLPSENAGLPWGAWEKFPYHITHKGTDYIRFYPAAGLDFPIKSSYFINGIQTTKDDVKALCLASEFSKSDDPRCFTVKAENVKSVGPLTITLS